MTEMGSVAGGALLGGAARGPQYTVHGQQAGGALAKAGSETCVPRSVVGGAVVAGEAFPTTQGTISFLLKPRSCLLVEKGSSWRRLTRHRLCGGSPATASVFCFLIAELLGTPK